MDLPIFSKKLGLLSIEAISIFVIFLYFMNFCRKIYLAGSIQYYLSSCFFFKTRTGLASIYMVEICKWIQKIPPPSFFDNIYWEYFISAKENEFSFKNNQINDIFLFFQRPIPRCICSLVVRLECLRKLGGGNFRMSGKGNLHVPSSAPSVESLGTFCDTACSGFVRLFPSESRIGWFESIFTASSSEIAVTSPARTRGHRETVFSF